MNQGKETSKVTQLMLSSYNKNQNILQLGTVFYFKLKILYHKYSFTFFDEQRHSISLKST